MFPGSSSRFSTVSGFSSSIFFSKISQLPSYLLYPRQTISSVHTKCNKQTVCSGANLIFITDPGFSIILFILEEFCICFIQLLYLESSLSVSLSFCLIFHSSISFIPRFDDLSALNVSEDKLIVRRKILERKRKTPIPALAADCPPM